MTHELLAILFLFFLSILRFSSPSPSLCPLPPVFSVFVRVCACVPGCLSIHLLLSCLWNNQKSTVNQVKQRSEHFSLVTSMVKRWVIVAGVLFTSRSSHPPPFVSLKVKCALFSSLAKYSIFRPPRCLHHHFILLFLLLSPALILFSPNFIFFSNCVTHLTHAQSSRLC